MSKDSNENNRTLFKSHRRTLRVMTHVGVISFKSSGNGSKFATLDDEIESYVKTQLMKDRNLGIFIDPKEPTIDMLKSAGQIQVREEELDELIARQSEALAAKHEDTGATPTVATTGTSSANTATDVTASLRQQLAARTR